MERPVFPLDDIDIEPIVIVSLHFPKMVRPVRVALTPFSLKG